MIRLSYSALNSLHTCERMFQLERLLAGAPERLEYPATVLGTAYGTAVQSYLTFQDTDLALFDGWKAYYPVVEDEKRSEETFTALFLSSFVIASHFSS